MLLRMNAQFFCMNGSVNVASSGYLYILVQHDCSPPLFPALKSLEPWATQNCNLYYCRNKGLPPSTGLVHASVGIFGDTGRVWAPVLHSDPPKKELAPHSSGWWHERQILTSSQQSNLTVSEGRFYRLY